jgi:glycosyltransferase involved in cell wall biosynthesis
MRSSTSPLVSVILATYNGEGYLKEQLESVLAQTWPYLEIIAMDDGSRDNTLALLNEYAAREQRMKVYVNENNLGFVKNFERGCALSSGELIALCDQDDFWDPEKVEKMVRAIGDHPMIYCDSQLCDKDLQYLGRNISELVNNESFYDCIQLCVFCRMYGHATLFTRGLFEKSRPFIREIPHDGWLAYHATLYGGVKYLPEALVKYRQHPANVFGVVGGKSKKEASELRSERKKKEKATIRMRMQAYYEACPDSLAKQKRTLKGLTKSYRNFSIGNDFRRMLLFFANYRLLLTVKKYSRFRKWLFCLKMFVKIK